jgi:hypothetical protein
MIAWPASTRSFGKNYFEGIKVMACETILVLLRALIRLVWVEAILNR